MTIQRGLALLGFEVGPLDGIFGRRTRGAIRNWQASGGSPVTGYLDARGAEVLLAAGGGQTPPRQDPARRFRNLEYGAKIAAAERLDDRRRATALLAVSLEQAAGGDIRDALGTARRIERAYFRSYALTSVAKHQASSGDLRGATQSLSAALAAARTVADATQRALALERVEEARAAIREGGPRPDQPPPRGAGRSR